MGDAVDTAEVQLTEQKEQAEQKPKVAKAALKDQAPGLFGVSYADWGSLVAALLALWTFLGLFFWLLINIAVKMRGNDYKGITWTNTTATAHSAQGVRVLAAQRPQHERCLCRHMPFPDHRCSSGVERVRRYAITYVHLTCFGP